MKKRPGIRQVFEFIGRGEKIRTSDPLHPMQVRYQAALRPDRTAIIASNCAGRLRAEHRQDAFELAANVGKVDLAGAGFDWRWGRFIQAISCAVDGEAVLIKELANSSDQQHFMVLVIAAIAPPLERLELSEFLFPVAQNMRFHAAQFADFTNGEVTLGGNGGKTTGGQRIH